MHFKQAARDMQQQIVKWRRDLHQIPELSFELQRTSRYVIRELRKMGLSCRRMAQNKMRFRYLVMRISMPSPAQAPPRG